MSDTEIAWAARVEPQKIRRLYQSEAAGRLADDLLDDVGVGLWARCESIMRATEAHRGRLQCPSCGSVIEDPARRRFHEKDLVAACDCGWSTSWGSVLRSLRGKELVAGAAEPYFRRFLDGYPKAASARDRMLQIDALLHEFHSDVRFGDVRPAAINVVAGRMRDVMALLDELAGFSSTPGQDSWRRRARESVFGRRLASRSNAG